jgi:tRNA(Arg) A34 adenosine deaminase TadA
LFSPWPDGSIVNAYASSPERVWAELEPACNKFELAWQSFLSDEIAIGAVLMNDAGTIVGRGQNRRHSSQLSELPGLLGHPEMNALRTLSAVKRYDGYVLYTTLFPCPMCLGAIVIAQIGTLRFASADPRWTGMDRLHELSQEASIA